MELAGDGDITALSGLLPEGERVEMADTKRGVIRSAVMKDGVLQAALFVSRSAELPPRDWLVAQLGKAGAAPFELLAGRPATPAPDRGRIICVCFDVGLNVILSAIAEQKLVSIEAIGAALGAGTNCGSCRPAIAALLEPGKDIHHG